MTAPSITERVSRRFSLKKCAGHCSASAVVTASDIHCAASQLALSGGLRCVGEDALPAQYVPLLDCHLNQSTDDPLIWDCSKTSSGERVVNPSKRWKGK